MNRTATGLVFTTLCLVLAGPWAPAQAQTERFSSVASNEKGTVWKLEIAKTGTKLRLSLSGEAGGTGLMYDCPATDLKPDGTFLVQCRGLIGAHPREVKGDLKSASVSADGRHGGGTFVFK